MASGKSILSTHGDKLLLGASILAVLITGGLAFLRMLASGPDVSPSPVGKSYQSKGVEELKKEFDQLGQAYAFSQTNLLQFASQMRVACTNCTTLLPWEAEACWKCNTKQPKRGAKTDTDNDGVPDVVEIANGMDPGRDDTHEDLDKDGFDNLEELNAGTNPNDPASHPSAIIKLRVRAISDRPLKFLLKEITKAGNSVILQVSIAGAEKIVRLGESVNGWLIKSYDDATKTLTITHGSESFRLPRGSVVEKNRRVAELVSLLDGHFRELATPGQTLKLFGGEYLVVEIQEAAVVLKSTGEGEKIVVPMLASRNGNDAKSRAGSTTPIPNPASPATSSPTPFEAK